MKIQHVLIKDAYQVELQSHDLSDAISPTQVLIQTRASFISAGTELSIYTGLDSGTRTPGAWCCYPFRSGYANVGVIVKAGKESGLDAGQRVFTLLQHASHVFSEGRGRGVIVPLADDIEDGVAAATRMAHVAMSAIRNSECELDDWVAVLGLGAVGNLACQLYQLRGARVIGIDPFEPRRALAAGVGVRHVVGGAAEEVRQRVMELTGGQGARIAVDAVGDARVIQQAAALTAPHGQIVLLGTPRADVEGNVTELLRLSHTKWITIRGALEWNMPRLPAPPQRQSVQGVMETAFSLVRQGRLQVAPLISHRLRPSQIKTAYEGLLKEKDKYWGVVLDWT